MAQSVTSEIESLSVHKQALCRYCPYSTSQFYKTL